MKHLRRFLEFVRFTDTDGNLSLTHAALVFACTCIWVGKPISLPEFGTLALALGAYQLKKYLNAPPDAPPAPAVDLAPLEAKVKELAGHVATILNKPALERFGLTRKP